MSRRRIKNESADFANFNPKMVAMAQSLERSQKKVKSVIYYQIPTTR